jgi:thioredoxin 1
MNLDQFTTKVKTTTLPMLVEFSAEWCAPCKALEVLLHEVCKSYEGKVELVEIDVDKNHELLSAQNIMSIPTLIGYVNGKEVVRRTGLQSKDTVEKIFQALSDGKTEISIGMPLNNRILKVISGALLIILGALKGPSVLLIVLGALIAFTGFYDQIPFFKLLFQKVNSWLKK